MSKAYRLFCFFWLAVILLTTAPVWGSTLHVNTTGWYIEGGAFHPSETPIQHAVDNATGGDLVLVASGFYDEGITVDKGLIIESENGPEFTTIRSVSGGEENLDCFEVLDDGVSIIGFSLTNGTYGVKGYNVNNLTVENCNTFGNYIGVYLREVSEGRMEGIHTYNNTNCGFYLRDTDHVTVLNSRIEYNGEDGIEAFYSDLNRFQGNTITNSDYLGIEFGSCRNNTVYNNTIRDNVRGISLYVSGSIYPSGNLIYLNTFDNTMNANTEGGSSSPNDWNSIVQLNYVYNGSSYSGYLGNYWSDHEGTDSDGDGVCDNIYYIDETANDDYYPLFAGKDSYTIQTEVEDNTPPNIWGVVVDPETQEKGQELHISCNVTDGYSGVENVWANVTYPNGTSVNRTLNPVEGTLYQNTDVYPRVGNYSFLILATDSSGNLNTSASHSFTIIDTTSPSITIYSPLWEEIYDSNDIELSVSADEPIDTWWYNLDSGSNTTFTPDTIILVEDGAHSLFVYANDSQGNLVSQEVGFWVDATPPNSITGLEYISGLTWVNWTWDNPTDEDFAGTRIYLDGDYITSTGNEFYNLTELDPSTPYTLSTQTEDSIGNVNETWVNSTALTSDLVSDTMYVNTSGWWFEGGAFHENPLSPIQAAVTNSVDDCSIYVQQGEYSESVLVDKRLSLLVNGSVTLNSTGYDYCFNLTADHTNLTGFNLITLSGTDGAVVDHAAGCRVVENDITVSSSEGSTRNGILLSYSPGSAAINNDITVSGFQPIGVYNYHSDGTIITGNSMQVVGDSADGIQVFYSYSTVTDNQISTSGITSNPGYALYLYSAGNSTLEGNNLTTDLEEYYSRDLRVVGSFSGTLAHNLISGVDTTIECPSGWLNVDGVGESLKPQDPDGYMNISSYLNIWKDSPGWAFLNITYKDSDLPLQANETTLRIWRYDEGWVESGWNGTRVLDTVENVVGVNITSFSIFAPLSSSPDTTPPDITFTYPTPSNGTITNLTSLNITIQSDEPLDTAILEWDGGNQSMDGSGTQRYRQLAALEEGTHEYRVYANDTSGNSKVTGTRLVTIDIEAPDYSRQTQDKQRVMPGETVNVGAFWSDIHLSHAWIETNHTVEGGSTWHVREVAALAGNGSWSNFTLTPTSEDLGNYIGWRIHANDTAGNQNTTAMGSFLVYQPPEVVSYQPGTSTVLTDEGQPQSFNLTLDQPVTVTWLLNGTQVHQTANTSLSSYQNTSADTGNWNLTARASNENGTTSQHWTWIVTAVDTTAPHISSVQESVDPQEAGKYLNITCLVTDDQALGQVNVSVSGPGGFGIQNSSMDAGPASLYYLNRTYSIPGSYSYAIVATDLSGNQNSSLGHSFQIQDTTTPNIRNLTADPSAQSSGGYVALICEVTDILGVDTVLVNVTSPNSTSRTFAMNPAGGSSYFFNNSYGDIGLYTFTVKANDTIGNTAISGTSSFTIQNMTPPNLTYMSPTPPDGSHLSSSADSVTIMASSDKEIQDWILGWNGVNQTPKYSGTTKTWTVPVSAGNYYSFEVFAEDAAGNSVSAGSRAFTVESPPPPPTVPDKVTGLVGTEGYEKVLLDWDTPYNGGLPVTEYRIYRGMDSNQLDPVPVAKISLTQYTDSLLTNGHTYYYEVSAVNLLGEGPRSDKLAVTVHKIHNLETGEGFPTIQSAIDDPDTADGHTILVDPGSYQENLLVDKQLAIISHAGPEETTIEGTTHTDDVVHFTDSNITLDGFNITGASKKGIYMPPASGILLWGSQNCTITNNWISQNYHGITFVNSPQNLILRNDITGSSKALSHYIGWGNSPANHIHENTMTQNTVGLDILYASGWTISSNNISQNSEAIHLPYSSGNLIYDNYFDNDVECSFGFDSPGANHWNTTKTQGSNIVGGEYLGGNFWADYQGLDLDFDGLGDTGVPYWPGDHLPLVRYPVHNLDTDDRYLSIQEAIDDPSTRDGHTLALSPVTYEENLEVHKSLSIRPSSSRPQIIPPSTGQPGLRLNAPDIFLQGLVIHPASKKGGTGVVTGPLGTKILDCNISGYATGIEIIPEAMKAPVEILNSTLQDNGLGVSVTDSDLPHLISGNSILDCNKGIQALRSTALSIDQNELIDCGNGLLLEFGQGNLISNNFITGSKVGFELHAAQSNFLQGNNLTDNELGIKLVESKDNLIFNNYLDNLVNAQEAGENTWFRPKEPGINIMGGSFIGGNYWSDYQGEDIDGDTLGDDPHEIGKNADMHPLMRCPVLNANTSLRYTSIHHAVENPMTLNGHLILVDPGKYREDLIIEKSISIQASPDCSLGEVLVEARHQQFPVFHVMAPGVEISGLLIRGATAEGTAAIYLEGVTDCLITGNRIRDNREGIRLMESKSEIHGNHIVDNRLGLRVINSDDNLIYDNILSNVKNVQGNGNSNHWAVPDTAPYHGTNIIGGPKKGGNYWNDYTGIDLNGDWRGDAPQFYNIPGDAWDDSKPLLSPRTDPIHIQGNDDFSFANGVLYGTGKPYDPYGIEGHRIDTRWPNTETHAIWLENTDAHVTIRGCNISGSPQYSSILLDHVENANIEHCYSHSLVGRYYIHLESANGNQVSHCKIDADNSPWCQAAVYLNASNANSISGNRVLNCDQSGIELQSSHDNTIGENDLAGNVNGLKLVSSNNNRITGNNAYLSNQYGICLYSSSQNVLATNNASFNSGQASSAGIYLHSSSQNSLKSNLVTKNDFTRIMLVGNTWTYEHGARGIELQNSQMNELFNNTATFNGGVGISLGQGSHSNGLLNNTVVSNPSTGMRIKNSDENHITYNLFSCPDEQPQENALVLDSSVGNQVYTNYFRNNGFGIRLTNSQSNLFYNNYLDNYWYDGYTYNVFGDISSNEWNITKTPGRNIIGGPWMAGNYWSDYTGADLDGDKLGDTPFHGDAHPLLDIQTIHIIGDDDFTPEKKVMAGSGTASDPYLIENLDIDASTSHGIWIENTTAHFTIRDCSISRGRDNLCYGVYLDNVENGKLENMNIDDNHVGLAIDDSKEIKVMEGNIAGNHMGIRCDFSSSIQLLNNTISENQENIQITNCSTMEIFENQVELSPGRGLLLADCGSCTVSNNTFQDNHMGLSQSSCPQTNITGNFLDDNYHGLHLIDSPQTLVESNNVYDNVEGMKIENSPECLVTQNNFSANELGGLFIGSSNTILRDNRISENQNGIKFTSCDHVSITGNYLASNRFLDFISYFWTWHTAGTGLWISQCQNATIFNNTMVDNGRAGLLLEDSQFQARGNQFRSNHGSVEILDSHGDFENNVISSSSAKGVFIDCPGLTGEEEIHIRRNTIYDGGSYGIKLMSFGDNHDISQNRLYENNISVMFESPTPGYLSHNAIYGNRGRDIAVYSDSSSEYVTLESIYSGRERLNTTGNLQMTDSSLAQNDTLDWGSPMLSAMIHKVESTQYGVNRNIGDLVTVHVKANSSRPLVHERLFMVDRRMNGNYEIYNSTMSTSHVDKAIAASVWALNDSVYDLLYEVENDIGQHALGYVQVNVKHVDLKIINVTSTFAERIYSWRRIRKPNGPEISYSQVYPESERGSILGIRVKNNGTKSGFGRIEVDLPSYLEQVTRDPVRIVHLDQGEEANYTFHIILTEFDLSTGWKPQDPSVFPDDKKLPIEVRVQNYPSYTLAESLNSSIEFRLGPIFKMVPGSHDVFILEKITSDPNRPYDGDGDNVLEAAESYHYNLDFINIGDEPADIERFLYSQKIFCNSLQYRPRDDQDYQQDYISHGKTLTPMSDLSAFGTDRFPNSYDEFPLYFEPQIWNESGYRIFGELYPQDSDQVPETSTPRGTYLTKSIDAILSEWWLDNSYNIPPVNYSGDVQASLLLTYNIPGDSRPYRYYARTINTDSFEVEALNKTFSPSQATLKEGDVKVKVRSVDIEEGSVQLRVENLNGDVFFEYRLDSYYDSSPEGYKWYHTIPPEYGFNAFCENALKPNVTIPQMTVEFGVKWSLWANELKLGMMALEAVVNIILAETTGGAVSVPFSDTVMAMTETLLQVMNAYESMEQGVPPVVTINGITIDGQDLADSGLDRQYFQDLGSGDVGPSTIDTFINAVWEIDGLKEAFGREVMKAMAGSMGMTGIYNKMMEPGPEAEQAFSDFSDDLLDYLEQEDKLTSTQAKQAGAVIEAAQTFIDMGKWTFNNIAASGYDETIINIIDPPGTFTTEFERRDTNLFGGLYGSSQGGSGSIDLNILDNDLVEISGDYRVPAEDLQIPLEGVKEMTTRLSGQRHGQVMEGNVSMVITPQPSHMLQAASALRKPGAGRQMVSGYFLGIDHLEVEPLGSTIEIWASGKLNANPDDVRTVAEISIKDGFLTSHVEKSGWYLDLVDGERKLDIEFAPRFGVALGNTELELRDEDEIKSLSSTPERLQGSVTKILNHPPIIIALQPSNHTLDTAENVALSARVQDQDEEPVDVKFFDSFDDSVIDSVAGVLPGDGATVKWSGLENGATYTFYVVVDDGKSTSRVGDVSFTTRENSAPSSPSMSAPQKITVKESITMSLSSADANDDKVRYGIDTDNDHEVDLWTDFSEPDKATTISHTWVDEGTYALRSMAEDDQGARSEWSQVMEITVEPAPNQAPRVHFSHPPEGTEIQGTIRLRGKSEDTDGSITEVQIRIDSRDWISVSGKEDWDYTLNTTMMENGEHHIQARSSDGSEYSNLTSLNLIVFNNHPPRVHVDSPKDGEIIEGDTTISGTCDDRDGRDTIQIIEIRIDGGDWVPAQGTANWSYDFSADQKEGEHQILVRAYDGHEYSELQSVTLKVDGESGFGSVFLAMAVVIAVGVLLIIIKRFGLRS